MISVLFAVILISLIVVILGVNAIGYQLYRGQSYADSPQSSTHLQYFACKKLSISVCDRLNNNHTGFIYFPKIDKILQSTRQPLYVDGMTNKAIELVANNLESVIIPDIPSVNSFNFSFSLFIKVPKDTRPFSHILSHVDRQGTAGWYLDMISNNGSNFVRLSISNTNGSIITSKEIPVETGKFMQIAGTFDGSSLSTYKNGNVVGRTPYTGSFWPYSLVPVSLGAASYGPAQLGWSGDIDNLLLFNSTLSPKEINDLYLQKGINNNTLVGNWSFDGDLSDRSQNHDDASLVTLISSMAFTPDGKLFFAKKNTGEIIDFISNKSTPRVFATLTDVYVNWEQGLLGMTIDPKYAQNKYIYAYYTTVDKSTGQPFNRVVRFTDVDGVASDTKILLDRIPSSIGYHSGGALAFGPDDKLYVTVGDATEHVFAQDPSIPIGKILRINRDGSIPDDNPIPGSPIFTLGHRNMYGIAFDKNHNIGIVTENGDLQFDEINLIKKGGNYGFPIFQPANVDPLLANESSIKPLRSYKLTIGPTQAIFYNGSKFQDLDNRFLFGTFTGYIYVFKLGSSPIQVIQEDLISPRFYPFDPVIGLATSPDGSIYFGGYAIYKIDSLNSNARDKFLVNIKIENASLPQIKEVMFNPNLGQLQISVNNQISDIKPPLKITIPKDLMGNLSSVTFMSQEGIAQTVDTSLNSTKVSVNDVDNYHTVTLVPDANTGRIIIKGTPILPPVQ